MASRRNCCISFRVFIFCPLQIPQKVAYFLPFPFGFLPQSEPDKFLCLLPFFCSCSRSTRISCKLASIVSSRWYSSSGSGSPSPHGRHERQSGPPFSLPGMRFMSKSNSCIYAPQRVTSAPGRSLVGRFSWCTYVLASVSTGNPSPYLELWHLLSGFISPLCSRFPMSYLFLALFQSHLS